MRQHIWGDPLAQYQPGWEPDEIQDDPPLVRAISELESQIGRDDPDFIPLAFELFDLQRLGFDTNSAEALSMARVMVKVSHLRAEQRKADGSRNEAVDSRARTSAGTVYYMRMRDLIKIGFTSGPVEKRRAALMADSVLATEPGSRALESKRHQQFAAYRYEGERFHPGRDLLLHIATLREVG